MNRLREIFVVPGAWLLFAAAVLSSFLLSSAPPLDRAACESTFLAARTALPDGPEFESRHGDRTPAADVTRNSSHLTNSLLERQTGPSGLRVSSDARPAWLGCIDDRGLAFAQRASRPLQVLYCLWVV